MKVFYMVYVMVIGEGCKGYVKIDDGMLDLNLVMFEGFGGKGGVMNLEQFFVVGYLVCFYFVFKLIVGKFGVDVIDLVILVYVGIGQVDGGFKFEVMFDVKFFNVLFEDVKKVVEVVH